MIGMHSNVNAPEFDKCLELLYAAGDHHSKPLQTMDSRMIGDPAVRLAHICRESIRQHLVTSHPNSNLFVSIEKLPLPPAPSPFTLSRFFGYLTVFWIDLC